MPAQLRRAGEEPATSRHDHRRLRHRHPVRDCALRVSVDGCPCGSLELFIARHIAGKDPRILVTQHVCRPAPDLNDRPAGQEDLRPIPRRCFNWLPCHLFFPSTFALRSANRQAMLSSTHARCALGSVGYRRTPSSAEPAVLCSAISITQFFTKRPFLPRFGAGCFNARRPYPAMPEPRHPTMKTIRSIIRTSMREHRPQLRGQ